MTSWKKAFRSRFSRITPAPSSRGRRPRKRRAARRSFLAKALGPSRVPLSTLPIVSTPQPLPPPPAAEITPPVRETRWLATDRLLHPDPKLRETIEAFIRDQRSEHTKRAYAKDLQRFVKFLLLRRQALSIPEINRSTIVAFKEFLQGDGLKSSSVDRHLASLRSFFGWLKDEELISDNPAERVRFLAERRLSPTAAFTDEEVIQVLNQPDLHTRSGALHYAILLTLFYCGLRRSELCALRLQDLLHERGKRALLVRGKGGKERLILLVPRVWHALQLYFLMTDRSPDPNAKSYDGGAPLFMAAQRGRGFHRARTVEGALDPSMVFYIVRKYAKAAGIPKRVSPHSCRATAISNARDHAVPDRAIQEFAGWSSTQMITHYDKRKTALEDSAATAIRYGGEETVAS